MATLPISVTLYTATHGLEDVDDGNLIYWQVGQRAVLTPGLDPSDPSKPSIEVTVVSARGAHEEARNSWDGSYLPVYEVIDDTGAKYCVAAQRLRHIAFRDKYIRCP